MCLNKRDPSGNRDVRGSKEVRDGGLQVRVCQAVRRNKVFFESEGQARGSRFEPVEKRSGCVWSAMRGRRESERRSVENGGEEASDVA